MREGGKVIPGIEKLAVVEAQVRAEKIQNEINGQPKSQESVNLTQKWVPPTPEELRELKKGLGKVTLGDIR